MTKSLKIGAFLFAVTFLFTCSKVDEIPFFEVVLDKLSRPEELGTVTLSGSIEQASDLGIINRQGFIWSTDFNHLQTDHAKAKWEEAKKDEFGNFSLDLSKLSLDSLYYFRAFAEGSDREAGNRLIFSNNIEAYSFKVVISVFPEYTRINDKVIITGAVTGLDSMIPGLADQGFIYAKDDPDPKMSGIQTFAIKELNNGLFLDTLTNLEFNSTYFVSAWGQDNAGEIIFSEDVIEIFVGDGWKRVADLDFPLTRAVSVSTPSKGFIAFGATDESVLEIGSNKLIEFSLAANPAQGSWSIANPDIPAEIRMDAVAFHINGFLYIGFGEDFFQPPFNRLVKFNTINGNQDDIINAPTISGRTSAVGFELHGKGYIGTGSADRNETQLLNDFWEFDPDQDSFRLVAPMPYKKSPNDPTVYNLGRYEAVSFVIGDEAFVGGGYVQGEGVANDFWKFTIDPNDPGDMGTWSLVSFFPGQQRYHATALVFEERAYFGTGEDIFNGTLNDWWEFVPALGMADGAWIPRTPIPTDTTRADAVGFSIGNRGFFGTGTFRALNSGTFSNHELSDIWEYIPEKN